jgi:hypothetical protein
MFSGPQTYTQYLPALLRRTLAPYELTATADM